MNCRDERESLQEEAVVFSEVGIGAFVTRVRFGDPILSAPDLEHRSDRQ